VPRDLKARIETGQLLLGGPETVIKQIESIHRKLGAGILDFTIGHDMGEKTLRCIDLLGSKVIPRMRDM
jgi:alkanesulfonate monooxygenase SsuD/methylene tetrahydromethanopterin reductase-like flavin-dependent oxidoreductase (luciferase family)